MTAKKTPGRDTEGWAAPGWRAKAGVAALAVVMAIATFAVVSGVWRAGAPKRQVGPVEVSLVPARVVLGRAAASSVARPR